MKKITIYRFKRASGVVTVSQKKPASGVKYTTGLRLVADDGKQLTNDDGKTLYTVIDTDSSTGWTEIDAPIQEETPVAEHTGDETPEA